MNKTVVIYSSIYGHTKKYAEWIAGELNADIFELKSFDTKLLSDYDNLVFGSGLYAGRIAFVSILVKNSKQIKNKKIALFTVGTSDVSNEKTVSYIKEQFFSKFPKDFLENAKLFCFRGGIDYDKMSFVHKQMMNMLGFVLKRKKPEELQYEETQFLEALGKTVDFSDKNSIAPLVEFVKVDKGEK
jgi:menaquinone-dependent protoporphyrinogen IX oxidase